jgi:hypothetical protein
LVPVSIVTVEHVTTAQDWKLLQIKDGDSHSIAVRIPLMPEDRVVTLAYLHDNQRSVAGRFVEYASDGRLAGAALFEMFDGNDRLVIDHGASGAPVFDCKGQIAAVISTVITQILQTPFGGMRISTAWGFPNVVSVPVQQLAESLAAE